MASNPFNQSTTPAPAASAAPAASQASSVPSLNNGATAALPQFNNGASAGGEKLTDYAGQPLLIRPLRFESGFNTSNGPADIIEAEWIVLDPSAGAEVHSGLVFGKALVPGLHRYLESPNPLTLGVIGQGNAKPGQSAPWILQPLDDSYQELAIQAGQAAGWF